MCQIHHIKITNAIQKEIIPHSQNYGDTSPHNSRKQFHTSLSNTGQLGNPHGIGVLIIWNNKSCNEKALIFLIKMYPAFGKTNYNKNCHLTHIKRQQEADDDPFKMKCQTFITKCQPQRIISTCPNFNFKIFTK